MSDDKPLMIVLAGPNGAGKSTFFTAFLKDLSLPFLNADILARKTGIDAYAAAREITAVRELFVRLKRSFVLETVLSDPLGDKVRFALSLCSGIPERPDDTEGIYTRAVLDSSLVYPSNPNRS